jgi:hypothetical protein
MRFSQTLKHLAANELIKLEEGSGQRRIGWGSRLLEAYGQQDLA